MEIINYSKYKFNKMAKYELHSSIANTESTLFFLHFKEKWQNELKLFKKFYIDKGDYFGNKLLTINSLIDNKEEINIEELVFPERLVAVNDVICGFMMPYIDSTNLGIILSDLSISVGTKIELLKKVGEILKKVKKTSTYIQNFCLSDIHENNFILDEKSGKIYVVDLDSCLIGNNQPFPSRYLQSIGTKTKNQNPKYKKNEAEVYTPNYNSELLCYNIMVLNLISNSRINLLSIEEFYCYLCYLGNLGFDYNLLDCFSTIYLNQDNKNPLEYLDLIPKNIARADINVFKHIYKAK